MNFIYEKLIKKSSLTADIAIAICVILTGYFYYYENRKIVYNIEDPAMVNHIIKIVIGVLIIVVWFVLCLQNGAKKRYWFLIFTLLLWIIPQISKYFVDMVDFTTYTNTTTISILVFIKYISNINYLSLKVLGDVAEGYTGIPYIVILNCLIICFVIMFIIGNIIEKYYNSSGDRSNGKCNETPENSSSII
jgi:hypothetical protein